MLQRALESLEALDDLAVSALQFFVLALYVEIPLLQLVDILGLVIELLIVDLDLLSQIVIFLRDLSDAFQQAAHLDVLLNKLFLQNLKLVGIVLKSLYLVSGLFQLPFLLFNLVLQFRFFVGA